MSLFVASAIDLTCAVAPTDVFQLSANGASCQILMVDFWATGTKSAVIFPRIMRRTSPNVGVSVPLSVVKFNSTSVPAGATAQAYTINPLSLGDGEVLVLRQCYVRDIGDSTLYEYDEAWWATPGSLHPPVINPNEFLCINLASVVLLGLNVTVRVKWLEF